MLWTTHSITAEMNCEILEICTVASYNISILLLSLHFI
jgi:hypothetical protein